MAHILRDDEPSAVFEYDGEAKALYYRLTREPASRTVSVGDRVMVDVDADGQAVGIEVLNPPGFSMTVSTRTEAATDGGEPYPFHTIPHYWTSPPPGPGTTTNHLGTPCPKPRDGGMCGCDEDDLAGPRDCYRGRCDC